MNYIYVLLLILGFLPLTTHSQNNVPSKETLKLNNEIFNVIKKNSMFSGELNWKEIELERKALPLNANDSTSQQVLFDFYKNKLRAVGDKHSFFLSQKRITQIAKSPVPEHPQGAYLGDGIGWVKVPRCLNIDEDKDVVFANTIRNIIEKLDTENVITGWIVDLRQNTGGNMWPMVAGLNALVDDGIVGYFVEGPSSKKSAWKNENGKLSGTDKIVSTYKIKNNKVKIAVLIDGRTGSSGEMTAISFLGLPNVKSFGQTSAGYTTANYTFTLSNGSQLLLAKSYVADRTGKGYPREVVPDMVVNDLSNTKDDQVVQAAKKWLAQ